MCRLALCEVASGHHPLRLLISTPGNEVQEEKEREEGGPGTAATSGRLEQRRGGRQRGLRRNGQRQGDASPGARPSPRFKGQPSLGPCGAEGAGDAEPVARATPAARMKLPPAPELVLAGEMGTAQGPVSPFCIYETHPKCT